VASDKPRASSNPELGEYKGIVVLVLMFSTFVSAVSSGFYLEVDCEAWEGRLGVLVRIMRKRGCYFGLMFLQIVLPARPCFCELSDYCE